MPSRRKEKFFIEKWRAKRRESRRLSGEPLTHHCDYTAMYEASVTLANMALIINFITICVAILVMFMSYFAVKKQEIIKKVGDSFPMALETIACSEIPIAIVAVIADHMQIPLKDVVASYAGDAERRRLIALKAFHMDCVTDHFIRQFPSKFIRNGYIGEDLLAHKIL